MKEDLDKIRAIADYQFGFGVGEILFSPDIHIEYSKNTGRIRHIYSSNDILLANFRPRDAMFTLTIAGAQRIMNSANNFTNTVTVMNEVQDFIIKGKNVFAKHVISTGSGIRPGKEIIILNELNEVLAIGKAKLSDTEMLSFKTGVAVKTRRGRKDRC